MKKTVVTRVLVGLFVFGSATLASWANRQSSDYEKIGLGNPMAMQVVDDEFTFLTDDDSRPYMTICINKVGDLLVHWNVQNERVQMFPKNVDELKEIILRRFKAKDYPKEYELFHLEIDPSTPDSKILAVRDMLLDLGVRYCHLAVHSPATLPPPPVAIRQEDVLTIVEDDSDVEDTNTNDIFNVVEEQPEFPGGRDKMTEFIQKNIQYPALCKKEGIQGRVVVQFVVNKDGSICDAKIVKSVDPHLDTEALRIIRAMPRWVPGKQKGETVRVRYTLPVNFRLPQ